MPGLAVRSLARSIERLNDTQLGELAEELTNADFTASGLYEELRWRFDPNLLAGRHLRQGG